MTEIAQLPPAARLVPQVLVWVKLPVMVMPVMVSAALPLLDKLTPMAALVVFANWLAKESEVAESLAVATEAVLATPLPDNATACGLPVALSATRRLPLSEPAFVGAKVTEMVQLALAARVDGQLLVCPKLAGAVMLDIVRLLVELLSKVTFLAVLVVFTFWAENDKDEGDREMLCFTVCNLVGVATRSMSCACSDAVTTRSRRQTVSFLMDINSSDFRSLRQISRHGAQTAFS